MEQTAYLVLQNGQVFTGKRFGAQEDVKGEVVFTTSMVGYLETMTDPNYKDQIVVQTFPLLGNYGYISEDLESAKAHLKGYIVYEYCQEPSNFRSEGCLDIFLNENNIVGLFDVDTRSLTKTLRENGTMNGIITSSVAEVAHYLKDLESLEIKDAVEAVSCNEQFTTTVADKEYNVVLWDMGAKNSLRKELTDRKMEVTTVPYNTKAADILALNPDGVIISDGPGNPVDNKEIIKEIQALIKKNVPVLAIGLGHQMVAIAQGAKTYKLPYGHRGGSQSVRDLNSDRIYITNQNHGYAVDNTSVGNDGQVNYVNTNDKSCEGIIYKNKPVISVQFQPITAAGPLDTGFIYDKFAETMKGVK